MAEGTMILERAAAGVQAGRALEIDPIAENLACVELQKQAGPQLLLECRTVLAAGERAIKVEGPALEDEAELVLLEV